MQNLHYCGDILFWKKIQEIKNMHHIRCSDQTTFDNDNFIEVRIPKLHSQTTIMCNEYLQKFQKHMDSMIKYTNRGNDEVCGKTISSK